MRTLKTLALSSIMATTIIIPAVAFTQNTEAATIKPGVTKHTQQEIKKFYTDKKINLNSPATFSTASKKNNVPGVLDSKTKTSALNTLNYVRYITGISSNVKINEKYSAQTQAGAYLNDLLRTKNRQYLSHSPSRPSGINNTIYNLGRKGAGASNVSASSHINKSILSWMNENNNLSKDYPLGHRMYMIAPELTETAFGSSKIGGDASAMYVFGKKQAASQKNVVWPAQQTPIDLFGNTKRWSVSSIKNSFNINKVKVKITRTKDKKVWNISKSNTKDGSLFKQTIASNTYLMFEPKNLLPAKNETYNVEISNLGADTLSYSVTFFDIRDVKTTTNTVSVKVVNGVKKTYKGSSFYKYTGLVNYKGTWYYFANGVHNTKYVGLSASTANSKKVFYVKGGTWQNKYNGKIKYNKKTYNIKNGTVV